MTGEHQQEQTCRVQIDWTMRADETVRREYCGARIVDLNGCTKRGCTQKHRPQLFCEAGHPAEAGD